MKKKRSRAIDYNSIEKDEAVDKILTRIRHKGIHDALFNYSSRAAVARVLEARDPAVTLASLGLNDIDIVVVIGCARVVSGLA